LAQRAKRSVNVRPRRCATEISFCAHGRSIPKELFLYGEFVCDPFGRYFPGHPPHKPATRMPYLARPFCGLVVRSGRTVLTRRGWNFLLELLVMAASENASGSNGPRHASRSHGSSSSGSATRHQVVFHTRPIPDVLWRTVAVRRRCSVDTDIRIRLQNGLQQQVMLPVSPKSVHILELSSPRACKRDGSVLAFTSMILRSSSKSGHGLLFCGRPELRAGDSPPSP